MIQKEPFFDDNINAKTRLTLSPHAFKISPSTNYPLMVSAQPPSASKAVRRPSREPYYHSGSKSSRSASSNSSSYAKLSDIFDFRYIDELRSEANENALVFDSDSDYDYDYDDDENNSQYAQATSTNNKWINMGEMSNFEKDSARIDGAKNGHIVSSHKYESEDESELEEYSVHMLTFKVNSRAQYTRPPRASCSSASDYFDEPKLRVGSNLDLDLDLDLPRTVHHPRFAAPKCKTAFVDSVLPSPESDLAAYLNTCADGVFSRKLSTTIPAVVPCKSFVDDNYDTHKRKPTGTRDDFEIKVPVSLM